MSSRNGLPAEEYAPYRDPIGHGIDGVVLDGDGVHAGFGSSDNYDAEWFVCYQQMPDDDGYGR